METIEDELIEQIIKLSVLLIKQAKLEKKVKNCISCTIKNLFSCCNVTPKKQLENINNEINQIKELTFKKNSKINIKSCRVSNI